MGAGAVVATRGGIGRRSPAQRFAPQFRRAPGFRAWYLIRTGDGMATVTLCDEQAGADESVRLAAGWIRDNMPQLSPNPPEVSNGEVTLQFGGGTSEPRPRSPGGDSGPWRQR